MLIHDQHVKLLMSRAEYHSCGRCVQCPLLVSTSSFQLSYCRHLKSICFSTVRTMGHIWRQNHCKAKCTLSLGSIVTIRCSCSHAITSNSSAIYSIQSTSSILHDLTRSLPSSSKASLRFCSVAIRLKFAVMQSNTATFLVRRQASAAQPSRGCILVS